LAIVTPLFGYSLDGQEVLKRIRAGAPNAFVLGDEAQSYAPSAGADSWQHGVDGVLLSLGLGKMLTSLSGGLLLLRDDKLAAVVRAYRDTRFVRPSLKAQAMLIAKGCAAMAAYSEPCLSLLQIVGRTVPAVARLLREWDNVEQPGLPDNAWNTPSPLQAAIGLRQLGHLPALRANRIRMGAYYDRRLPEEGFRVFAHSSQPTWPRYPFAVSRPRAVGELLARQGIQVGSFLDYSSADLPAYRSTDGAFPNASHWGSSMINLPNWFNDERLAERVIEALIRVRRESPGALAVAA
jgi:dTDP-4-amino-4,6-dideoxygalactose transaminase